MKKHSLPLLAAAAAFTATLLAGCATPPASPPCVCQPGGESKPVQPVLPPAAKPLQAAHWSDLPGWGEDDLRAAWPAFLQSCKGLKSTVRWQYWRATCEAASSVDSQDNSAIGNFLQARLQPYQLVNADGSTSGLITGYYEPLLRGAKKRNGNYRYPLLAPPDDLLTIDLGELHPELKNLRLRGRLQGNKVVPYGSRADIVANEGHYLDKALAWVDDAVELFFLQIQGSGRIQLPDGSRLRVGYADQNGHPYISVGRVLLDRGDLKPGEASMQGIQSWARAHPEKLADLLNANPSYVFFRELKGNPEDGPPGALGVPLTAERSLAVDPRSTPLGAPVFLAASQPNSDAPLNRLMLAQDTGGAIKGVVRADFFWGFGDEAGEKAGRTKQSGRMWVLLPPGHPVP